MVLLLVVVVVVVAALTVAAVVDFACPCSATHGNPVSGGDNSSAGRW